MAYSNSTTTLDLHCHAETEKAMLLSNDGKEDNAEWTPKSQIVTIGAHRNESGEFEMKEWIAIKNGFV